MDSVEDHARQEANHEKKNLESAFKGTQNIPIVVQNFLLRMCRHGI
jgi:hypothetical protein